MSQKDPTRNSFMKIPKISMTIVERPAYQVAHVIVQPSDSMPNFVEKNLQFFRDSLLMYWNIYL